MKPGAFLGGIIFLVLALYSIPPAIGLSCQYTHVESKYEPGVVDAATGDILGPPLRIEDAAPTKVVNVRIFNTLNQDITINVELYYAYSGGDGIVLHYYEVHIPENGSYVLAGLGYAPGSFDKSTFSYIFVDPLNAQLKNVSLPVETCDKCPPNSETICLNDGMSCVSSDQCGSRICRAGLCANEKYVPGDNLCDTEWGENCENSPKDCSCGANRLCQAGNCVDDCENPPEGYQCCGNSFHEMGKKAPMTSCSCSFECIGSHKCQASVCVPDCDSPPEGQKCCNGRFSAIQGKERGALCACEFECKNSVCYQGRCTALIQPKLRCDAVEVEKGQPLDCTAYAGSMLIPEDVPAAIQIEIGPGLTFSSGEGCDIIQGECVGSFSLSRFNTEGVHVRLDQNSFGKVSLRATLTYDYKGNSFVEKTEPFSVRVKGCGDGVMDQGETKENCCTDVPPPPPSKFAGVYRVCEMGKLVTKPYGPGIFLDIVVVLCGGIFVFFMFLQFKTIRPHPPLVKTKIVEKPRKARATQKRKARKSPHPAREHLGKERHDLIEFGDEEATAGQESSEPPSQ